MPEIGFQFGEVSIYFCFGGNSFVTIIRADDHQPVTLCRFTGITAGFFINLGLLADQQINAGIFVNYNGIAVNAGMCPVQRSSKNKGKRQEQIDFS